ncbi:fatty acyl-CoA reductase wat-like [Macrosteles quadrilineatus]|uniref:fatty acyl-CoA reductase wat-like n=1 Tax=Macrosteles quadrilineatus TaxID=74068 RepID=UPI0023E337F0|nr:fatty acyl-CoA reductase wat-like [Macrosteles quadrilineatus]XP_054288690.1 fatty acyl-CoA reductase wat-like [Macrosteles quadrilineatus]
MESISNQDEFDLSNFFTDSLCLDSNISPMAKFQYQPIKNDNIEKMLKKDLRDALGYNNIGKPRQISESAKGTTVQEFYRGLNIMITGGSGFLGKILIEKMIRSIPHVGKVYVLVRAKKGSSAKDRFEKLLEDEVFLRMKTEVPDYHKKLTFVEGDISEPELGLSEADRCMLQDQIHVVFHSAADVRFVNSLRAAVNTNLVGAKRMVHLAKGMKNLKSYVHVSTAYSNCVRRVIEEKTYKLSVGYKDIMTLLEELSDEEISTDENRILQGWPNTYTFSKALCEDMLYEESSGLPLCIFRPSVVGPTFEEPLRAWTDNIYGPTGMLMAIGMGVLHIKRFDLSLPLDAVPVDLTVNAMIAVAWENATDRISSLPVYNFTTSPRNPVIWKRMSSTIYQWFHAYPFEQCIWYPFVMSPPTKSLERIGEFFLHKIPGHIFDRIAVATGKEPRLTKVYNKLSMLRGKLDYFLFGTWEFVNENTELLRNKLSEEDKKLFPYDISVVDIGEYILLSRLGVKYFYLKEKLENMPKAERKQSWLKILHYSVVAGSYFAALKLMVSLAHVLPI